MTKRLPLLPTASLRRASAIILWVPSDKENNFLSLLKILMSGQFLDRCPLGGSNVELMARQTFPFVLMSNCFLGQGRKDGIRCRDNVDRRVRSRWRC